VAPTNPVVVCDSPGTFVLLFFSHFPVGKVRRKRRNRDRNRDTLRILNEFELLGESTTKRARERKKGEGAQGLLDNRFWNVI
jgi:hypothetical protein